MQRSIGTFPVSIQFPSFGPSLQASPAKIDEPSTFESSSSSKVHKISIHLPEEFLQQNAYSQEMTAFEQNQNSSQSVRVYCRMRGHTRIKDSIKFDSTMIDDGENCYSFDYIFDDFTEQRTVYQKIAKRHVDDFFMGKNSTIFAYGQTGSGKTYTMFGNMNIQNQYGLIPRTLQQIFKRDLNGCTISCSMLEIYNEKLMDLFNNLTNSNVEIKLREFNDSIYLDGLQEILVQNQFQLINLIRVGHRGRKIAVTMNNDSSSRSHTILFVYRNFTCKNEQYRSKLCFIDLAGSEKVRKSGVKGQNLEETKKINLSLSCLGNVIHALTNGSQHIPYRNSKLTRILKDSLSSQYHTSIITTCSLDKNDHQQTISTIKFAVRAKKIKNKRRIEEQSITLEEQFIKLKRELEETKKQLACYKRKEVEDEENKNSGTEIPEQFLTGMEPVRSICISNGVSSRVRFNHLSW